MRIISPVIYKIINTVNNKIYVGKDLYNDPKYMGSGKLLKIAFLKYGKDNFRKEIIKKCRDEKHLNEQEVFWIKQLGSFSPTGYNINLGGKGGDTYTHRDEKDKISFRKKLSIANTGKSVSEAVKLKMSITRRGVPQKKRPNVECPHCHKIGDKINMLRWHFDYCNSNPNKITKEIKKLTCPHCNKILNACNALQWHFDYCKINPNRKLKDFSCYIPSEISKDKRKKTILENGGQHHTERAKQRISEFNKNKILSKKTKEKIRASVTLSYSKKTETYLCVHCGKKSKSKGNINRWHNMNCKLIV